MKQVLIVEDQRMPRNYMEQIIKNSDRYELVGSLYSAELAIIKCRQQPVDLILMDVCTIGNKDGIDAAAEIKQQYPKVKIIVVTSMAEVSFLNRAKKAKVDSFWYKDISPEELIEVIDRTVAGEHLFPDEAPRVKLGHAESTDLTAKEIEVLRLLCEGMEYKEIAVEMGVSSDAVKYHVSNILSKTGYANKTKLAIAVTSKKFIIPTSSKNDELV